MSDAVKIDCDNCDGRGFVQYYEDGQEVHDACYKCGTKGFITPEAYLLERTSVTVQRIADVLAANRRREAPDDERCDRMQAEDAFHHVNGVFELLESIGRHETVEAIIDVIAPFDQSRVRKPEPPVPDEGDTKFFEHEKDGVYVCPWCEAKVQIKVGPTHVWVCPKCRKKVRDPIPF